MGHDRPVTPKRNDGFLPFSMPEVTYDIGIWAAAAAAVSPHLYKNSPAPLSYHHGHHATKLSWWKWCHVSETTVNLIRPSRGTVAEDVAVREMTVELVLQSYFSCKR